MVKKGNSRVYVTLSEEQLELLDKLTLLSGASKSKIIQKAIADYVPSKIAFYERYYRGKKGIDPYTKEPLSENEQNTSGHVVKEQKK